MSGPAIRQAVILVGGKGTRLGEIAIGALQGHDVLIAFSAHVLDQRGAHEARGAGHKDSVGLVQARISL